MTQTHPRIALPLKARAVVAMHLVGLRLRVLGMRVGFFRR
jgi:hypothetical protein